MKIVMLEPIGISEVEAKTIFSSIEKRGNEFVFCASPLSAEEKLARAKDADVLIVANSPLSEEIIQGAPHLKLLSVAFTGVDHIPMDLCREKGITVCNAQGYCTHAVAELTFGLIIDCLRNITVCDKLTRTEQTKEGFIGKELYGKTIGIVGTGAIGIRVAEIAKAFGCKILGYSKTRRVQALEAGIQYLPLDELLKESDIITLHVPLTAATKHLINEQTISLMKSSAVLINVARGNVVDSNALATALNEERIGGAGIDVFETEPPIQSDHSLLHCKNTVVTPHVAFATHESMIRRAEIVCDNISAWFNGNPINMK